MFLGAHDFRVLLPHRLAQEIGLPEAVTAHLVGNFEDLFLKHDDTISIFQNFFKYGVVIADLFPAVLAIDVDIDHARIERTRTIKRVHGYQIGQDGWL